MRDRTHLLEASFETSGAWCLDDFSLKHCDQLLVLNLPSLRYSSRFMADVRLITFKMATLQNQILINYKIFVVRSPFCFITFVLVEDTNIRVL